MKQMGMIGSSANNEAMMKQFHMIGSSVNNEAMKIDANESLSCFRDECAKKGLQFSVEQIDLYKETDDGVRYEAYNEDWSVRENAIRIDNAEIEGAFPYHWCIQISVPTIFDDATLSLKGGSVFGKGQLFEIAKW